ncbi:hypothetical protein CHLNCDRAFT_138589 [Chlorella variabilis]|uniref:Tyrosine-protein kinase ephrin type A/B receptor-like domain-containing protein n=1 Tax=Chlorella variabilis TaxID=554065 RepID=E1ZNC3_CHLVA|nr:hypothetical protein CHLNCDRAFT_138589 [Chlorella variabilis]EFN52581.1 hypothetical protein CHLNCDRAFT_138589 [Chlorella variabilis]|eukprot:XP_005844683.1 hypothetical protein CHLNCDRAFT_138589 [Chlorella variabilis]
MCLFTVATGALVLLIATSTTQAGQELPLCAHWYAGPAHACPPTNKCKLWDANRNGYVMPTLLNTTNCAACSDGIGLALRCLRCKPGFVHTTHDHFRQECLPVERLGCLATRPYPTMPHPKAVMTGPCIACPPTHAMVWATSRAQDFYQSGNVAGAARKGGAAVAAAAAVTAAAAAVAAAAAPVQVAGAEGPVAVPADWPFPEMNETDYDNYQGARTWRAQRVCLTCADLGCPGACTNITGCTSCPSGSLLFLGAPVGSADTFLGEYRWGWLYGFPARKAPKLPAMCLDPVKNLRCAPGKWNAAGCTACPAGMLRGGWAGKMQPCRLGRGGG